MGALNQKNKVEIYRPSWAVVSDKTFKIYNKIYFLNLHYANTCTDCLSAISYNQDTVNKQLKKSHYISPHFSHK